MSLRDTLIQYVRTWADDIIGFDNPDSDIIFAMREPHQAPPRPFLTVTFTAMGTPIGTDESEITTDTDTRTGDRTGSMIISGFGAETYDWLEVLRASVHRTPDEIAIIATGSGIQDIAGMFGDFQEERYEAEFDFAYGVEVVLDTNTADSASITQNSDTITQTFTVDLS